MWHPDEFVIRAEDIAVSSDGSSQPAGQMVLPAAATDSPMPQQKTATAEPATQPEEAEDAEEAGEADKAEEAEASAEAKAQAEDTAAVEAASADVEAKASTGTAPDYNKAQDRPATATATGAEQVGQTEVEAVGGSAESAKKGVSSSSSSSSAAAAAQPADAGDGSSGGSRESEADGGRAPRSEPDSMTDNGSLSNHGNSSSTHWLTGAALPAFIAAVLAAWVLRRCRASRYARAGSLGSLPHGAYARSQLTTALLAARRTSGYARGSATSSPA
jgi:hypothetical protein